VAQIVTVFLELIVIVVLVVPLSLHLVVLPTNVAIEVMVEVVLEVVFLQVQFIAITCVFLKENF